MDDTAWAEDVWRVFCYYVAGLEYIGVILEMELICLGPPLIIALHMSIISASVKRIWVCIV